jgi:hypothetical protein
MKPVTLLLLISTSLSSFGETRALAKNGIITSTGGSVIHVATALDHLTVLELGETVTMVASGSPSFQIERHEDKVLVKPLKAGVSTDLLVWTDSRRLIYELEAPGEVADMNFAVDSRVETNKVAKEIVAPSEDSINSIMGNAFLAALPVDSEGIHPVKDGVTVRIEHLLVSKNNIYLHYSVVNRGKRSYRLGAPQVERLLVSSSQVSSPEVRRKQISAERIKKISQPVHVAVDAASVQMTATELKIGERAEGVIVLPQPLAEGSVLELTFPADGSHRPQAVVVL